HASARRGRAGGRACAGIRTAITAAMPIAKLATSTARMPPSPIAPNSAPPRTGASSCDVPRDSSHMPFARPSWRAGTRLTIADSYAGHCSALHAAPAATSATAAGTDSTPAIAAHSIASVASAAPVSAAINRRRRSRRSASVPAYGAIVLHHVDLQRTIEERVGADDQVVGLEHRREITAARDLARTLGLRDLGQDVDRDHDLTAARAQRHECEQILRDHVRIERGLGP